MNGSLHSVGRSVLCVGAFVFVCTALAMVAEGTPSGCETDQDWLIRRLHQLEVELAEVKAAQRRASAGAAAEARLLPSPVEAAAPPLISGAAAEPCSTCQKGAIRKGTGKAAAMACPCGACAGYNNGFYTKTCDDLFLLKTRVALQFRYIGNWRNPPPAGEDNFEGGFSMRRSAVAFTGHIASPKMHYFLLIEPSRSSGFEFLEEAKFWYTFDSGVVLQFGRFRDPAFLRELDVSFTRQLAAERSYVHSIFGTGLIEGVLLKHQGDWLRLTGIYHDGRLSGNPGRGGDFFEDNTDAGTTAGLDIKFAGEWAQYGDFTSWADEPWAAFVGFSFNWEEGETGDANPVNTANNLVSWTADVTLEGHGLSLFAAGVGRHSVDAPTPVNQYGFLAQAAYQICPDTLEPFVQYQYVYFDGVTDISSSATAVGDSTVNLLSGGFNWYLDRHLAKFTAEVIYAFDSIPVASTSTGLLLDAPTSKGQTVGRLQFQLFF